MSQPLNTTQANRPSSQRHIWQISGMDCPSCTHKITAILQKLPGIRQVSVTFVSQKLQVDADPDDHIPVAVVEALRPLGYRLTPLTTTQRTSPSPTGVRDHWLLALLSILMLAGWGIRDVYPVIGQGLFLLATLCGVIPVLYQAFRLIRAGTPFAIETLMSIASLGAVFIGATAEAALVLWLFRVGETLEAYATQRARQGITALMSLVPSQAILLQGERRVEIEVSQLRPDDIIEVAPGGRLPADGILLEPLAAFDESALTGESVPVERQRNAPVSAGCLVVDRVCRIEVTSEPGANAIDRILQLIEEAEARKAPTERFLDIFSRYYTPAIVIVSVLVMLLPPLAYGQSWDLWLYRGLALMLIGCPCALVISTPAAITSGLAAAARQGALIKGGAAMELLAKIKVIALDKTGTLTEGRPALTAIIPAQSGEENRILQLAAGIENGSLHPLASAIIRQAEARTLPVPTATERQVLPGMGVQGRIDGVCVKVIAPAYAPPSQTAFNWSQEVVRLENTGHTAVVVVCDDHVRGILALQDTLRADAPAALRDLRTLGIDSVMLTGDNSRAAQAIAERLDIQFQAGLLPEDKVRAVEALQKERPTAMTGDGINDAPAMRAASMGIAMGSGTDIALETADAALTHNRLTGLAQMIALARRTRTVIHQNIAVSLGLKVVFLLTSLLGLTGLWVAILADSGATVLVTFNALRLLGKASQSSPPTIS